jgi:glucosamine--fructose-6-phosphate aminotransferase (isomerizing)
VAHNGIIENAAELRAELILEGHRFASEVDSEVISHLIEHELSDGGKGDGGDLGLAVAAGIARLEGSWAVVVMDTASDRVVATAHRSPLVFARSAHGDFLASDIGAIAEWVNEFRVLRDDDLVELTDETGWTNLGNSIGAPASIPVTVRPEELQLGGHADFMSKEIEEQPDIASRILREFTPAIASGELWRELGLPPFKRVALLGCGTSLNAGKAIGAVFSRIGGVPVLPVIASEASDVVLEPDTLLLAISQSGETADVLRAIDDLDGSFPVLALTNNRHSSLGRRADAVLSCLAGPEIGVAATKTFVAQVVAGSCLALAALAASERIDRSGARVQAADLNRLPELLENSFTIARHAVPPLIDRIANAPGFLFLGRGPGITYAAEGALKLKELSYRWAEHFPAGELKHGPLALVEPGTPVIVIDGSDRRIDGNIAEVGARGGLVITIGGPGTTIPAVGISRAAALPGGMDSWGPLESVVPLQILARELAIALGHDVDKPRNLAKSVTVE